MFEKWKQATDARNSRPKFRGRWISAAAGAIAFGALLFGALPGPTSMAGENAASQDAQSEPSSFTGSREETERFLAYNRSITLSPEQEAIKRTALEALPAPCCNQFSAATCCCKCNMARATWGLAKHLVADVGLDADGVSAKVAEWHRTINPDGFSGDACFTGGCGRRFADNGCGGMQEGHLIH